MLCAIGLNRAGRRGDPMAMDNLPALALRLAWLADDRPRARRRRRLHAAARPGIDATFGRPKAIVTVSAHTAARLPVVLAAPRHEAIYDFGGFDPKLRTLRYDAPGDPALAARLLSC